MTYHQQKLCPEISALFQISTTPAFSFDELDFLYMATYSGPGSNVFYTVRFGNEITALRIAIVNSVKPFGPRSSINFTHYKWQTFAHHITNYTMVVLPSRTPAIKYYINDPARPRSVVKILGPVKCAYVIYGTFVRCTALAVRNLTRVPVKFVINSQFL